MRLTLINVGYGEAMLLTAERSDGQPFRMLIDGGSGEDEEYAGYPHRIRAADFLEREGITRLDVLVNTHIHEDHTCGLTGVAARCSVGEYWCCLLPDGHREWEELPASIVTLPCTDKCRRALNAHRALLARFRADGIRRRMLAEGTKLDLPVPGLRVEVIGPPRKECARMQHLLHALYEEPDAEARKKLLSAVDAGMNNHSVMLRLDYYGTKILLPGDTNRAGYAHLPAETLRADVFKVGHHGQRDGADAALAKAVSPRTVLVCASSDRRYESMHPEMLAVLAENGRAPVQFALSDVPELPPWTDRVPAHFATDLDIAPDGSLTLAYRV